MSYNGIGLSLIKHVNYEQKQIIQQKKKTRPTD